MTDRELDEVFAALSRRWRRKVVRSLLAGNDTQCFTTSQYRERWRSLVDKGGPSIVTERMSRTHLESLPDLVAEVLPGIWAARGVSDG